MKQKWQAQIKFKRNMSKWDLFLWLTVKCYSEVSTNRYWKIFFKMSDKRKYKKDSFTWEKRKPWNRETNSNTDYFNWGPSMQRRIRVRAVGCFCRGAPSLIFDGIVNATVSEISTTAVAQKNFELPLPPSSLDSHQTQNNKVKFWTDSTFPFPWRRRTHLLER